MKQKLASWKNMYLSKGVHFNQNYPIQIANPLLSLFPVFTMVAQCMEKLHWDFLWERMVWHGMLPDLERRIENSALIFF